MSFRAPIGQDDFRQIRRQGLVYVDKSRFIDELLEDGALVVLLPRPRRFGKSTNLSMLRYFFERPPAGEDRSDLFQDLEIWASKVAREHFQRHPVIAITLKEVKPASWDKCLADLTALVADLIDQHRWLLDDPNTTELDRAALGALLQGTASQTAVERSLLTLSQMLHRATGEEVVLLIDEYDTPIHAGWLGGYYQEVVNFFRVFLGAGLKGNAHLFKGVLTGILRVSKESIFSDINNLAVYTILRDRYNTVFGFTEEEVAVLVERAGVAEQLPEIRRWYNGYRFGDATIYNPWSVISFLSSEDFTPRAYWVNTSSNELVGRMITAGQEELSLEMERLLAGGKVRKPIEEGLVLPDLERRSDAVWSLLLFSGYLKAAAIHKGGREVTLAVPNREVMTAYDTLLQRWMQNAAGGSAEIDRMLGAMLRGDAERFEAGLSDLVTSALSFHDLPRRDPERVYHAFVLGLLVQLRATHRVESNPESGLGRADVLVIPKRPGRPGVVLEFKRLREGDTPERALDAAMEQIERLGYATRLVEAGAVPVRSYGVVFDGKRVVLRVG